MKKSLRIAQISPLWFPVPPKGYGGSEQVVGTLTEELVKRGHKVTLFAPGNSKTKAKLKSIVPNGLKALNVPWLHDSYNIINLLEGFSKSGEFDIVHTHIDVYDPIIRGLNPQTPSIATLHNHFWPRLQTPSYPHYYAYKGRVELYNRFKNLPYVSISDKYRELCPAKLNFVQTIHHGIEIDKYKFNPTGKDQYIWIGRISRHKGTHLAVQVAKKLGLKLLIAGVMSSDEQRDFFKKEIQPHLNKNIQFVGEVKGYKEKSDFYGQAKAFLYPLQWQEPFGITMIEAMACGTPVVALDYGSVPEIVKHGKTGFIAKNLNEFKKYISQVHSINREDCRRHVENNFTIEIMAENYEQTYYNVIKNWKK